jgi:hypothetical protein
MPSSKPINTRRRESLREYVRKLFSHVWTVVVTFVAGILGVAQPVAQSFGKDLVVPAWIWLAIFACGFVYAQFQAFHDMRLEREGLTLALEEFVGDSHLTRLRQLYDQGFGVRRATDSYAREANPRVRTESPLHPPFGIADWRSGLDEFLKPYPEKKARISRARARRTESRWGFDWELSELVAEIDDELAVLDEMIKVVDAHVRAQVREL